VPSVIPYIRASFGRRILLLFALCIVVPGAIFGYLSLRQVEEKFHQETMRRMRLQSREVGMSIHGGVSSPASWGTGRLPPSVDRRIGAGCSMTGLSSA